MSFDILFNLACTSSVF